MKIQKRNIGKTIWKTIGGIVAAILLCFSLLALVGLFGTQINFAKAKDFDSVGAPLTPVIDKETGCWTFTTDRDFKVLQLTDIHIGGGFLSLRKDGMALDAVSTLVKRVKPDLVIITGDIAYPFPVQSGSFDNKREAKLFATMMESLEVYWAITFGNHDTEVYSMFDREEIARFYAESDFKYCLFQRGPSNIDGEGNYIINVKNSDGLITQSFVMLDSHSYVKNDVTGIKWDYDNIHQNQIDWYKNTLSDINAKNRLKLDALDESKKAAYLASIEADSVADSMIKSLAFFHIPLEEQRDAWLEYINNGHKDTENVQYVFGVAGEKDKIVYCGAGHDELFETALALGSTQGFFCGHDHLNNFSITYKGIRFTYGMSIDHLAYAGIAKQTKQRGGTVILTSPDNSFVCYQEPLVR